MSRGVNIAALIGSLFCVGILSGKDAHRCMDTLVGTGPHFMKLLAAHAMFVNSGDRICSGKDGIRTGRLRTRLGQRNPQTGYLLWGPNEESHVLVLVRLPLNGFSMYT
jgi:hypothetical protein